MSFKSRFLALLCPFLLPSVLGSLPLLASIHRPVPVSVFSTRNSITSRRFSYLDKILSSRNRIARHTYPMSTAQNSHYCFKNTSIAEMPSSSNVQASNGAFSWRSVLLSTWGVSSVLLMMGNAIKRLLPIAIQPFTAGDFTSGHWAAYVAWTMFMLYTEGYKAFHKKFSPLVVKRAFLLDQNMSFLNVILAGPFCMGMFSASKARMIVSWGINMGVVALVFVVKQLPYPWRSIIDAGVVAGLTVGSLSMLYYYVRTLTGRPPDIDACMPTQKDL